MVFAFPFVWMLSTSLKPASDVFDFPPSLIPSTWEWSNYLDVLQNFPFAQGLSNTLIIIIGVEVGRLISVPLAAYAFARLRFPLRGPLFLLVLATMMLPSQVLLIPQYLVFRNLGWLNTFLPLTVPSLLPAAAWAPSRSSCYGSSSSRFRRSTPRPPKSTAAGSWACTSISFCPCRFPPSP